MRTQRLVRARCIAKQNSNEVHLRGSARPILTDYTAAGLQLVKVAPRT